MHLAVALCCSSSPPSTLSIGFGVVGAPNAQVSAVPFSPSPHFYPPACLRRVHGCLQRCVCPIGSHLMRAGERVPPLGFRVPQSTEHAR